MSVALLVVTHGKVGQALLDAADAMLAGTALNVCAVAVSNQCDPDEVTQHIAASITRINQGDGVLVLTDIYGATPSNIAMKHQADAAGIMMVAGVNLPMLIRVLNYPDLSVEQLLEKALSGGRDGIFRCQSDAG